MIRVLFVATGLDVGGAEISLLNILQHLDRSRFEAHVVSLTGHGDVAPRIAALGITVTSFDFARQPLRSWTGLRRLMRNLRPHVVQTWMYHADLIGGLAARTVGLRHVVWGIRNLTLDPQGSRRSTRLVAAGCARLSRWLPAAVVSCSHAARDVHQALGYRPQHFVVIGNGFDLSEFRPDPGARASVCHELDLPAEAELIIHVGRYHPHKNHRGLISALGLVHRQRPAAHFVLVGNDVDAANHEIVQAVADTGGAANFHLLGLRQDIARLIAASHLLVQSSTSEAFPRVLGEAMACGVPCVTTDVGDSRLIVERCGIVVPPDDNPGLARAILELLSLPADQLEELRRKARARALSQFDIRAVTRQYETFYMNLQGGLPCAA